MNSFVFIVMLVSKADSIELSLLTDFCLITLYFVCIFIYCSNFCVLIHTFQWMS